MRKTLLIAWREYRATVVTKAFLIGMAMMPILIGAGVLLQFAVKDQVDVDDKRIMVVDQTGKLFSRLVEASERRSREARPGAQGGPEKVAKYIIERPPQVPLTDQQRLEASDRIRQGELYALVELPTDLLELPGSGPEPRPTYVSLGHLVDIPRNWLEKQLTDLIRQHRFEQTKLDADLVQRIMAPVSLAAQSPYEASASGGTQEAKPQNAAEAAIVPLVILVLMSLAIFGTAQGLLQCVLEEKQLRIAEVLLGSVDASHLMAGKLIGNVGASITMVMTYLAGVVALAAYYDQLELISPTMVAWFLVYQVLAVLLFGSLFLAVGAACSNASETQNLLLPVIVLAIFPMFIWIAVVQEPLGRFATLISFIPTATPILMLMRMAASPAVPWWQPVLGLVLVVLTTCLFTLIAARVFRIGILSRGKAPGIRELTRWVLQG